METGDRLAAGGAGGVSGDTGVSWSARQHGRGLELWCCNGQLMCMSAARPRRSVLRCSLDDWLKEITTTQALGRGGFQKNKVVCFRSLSTPERVTYPIGPLDRAINSPIYMGGEPEPLRHLN